MHFMKHSSLVGLEKIKLSSEIIKKQLEHALTIKKNNINLEHSLRECVNINKTIMKFSKIIINTFLKHPNHITYYNYNYAFYGGQFDFFYPPKDELELIYYLEHYIYPLEIPSTVVCWKGINVHGGKQINHFILLNDGRIASASDDLTIKVINPNNFYKCEVVIQLKSIVHYITEIDNGNIATISNIKDITIFDINNGDIKFQVVNAHKDKIIMLIALSNGRIASSSVDGQIKIWKVNNSNIELVKVLVENKKYPVNMMIQIRNKEILLTGCRTEQCIKVWNLNVYQCQTVIKDISCERESILELNDNKILIGNATKFQIMNIYSWEIEKTYDINHCFNMSDETTISFIRYLREQTYLFSTSYSFLSINFHEKKNLIRSVDCIGTNGIIILNNNLMIKSLTQGILELKYI